MNHSDSSTGEYKAVRRHVDLDDSFTGSAMQRHGQHSLVPEATDAVVVDFNELLDWLLTLQQIPETGVVSIGSGYLKNVMAGDSVTSKLETDGDKYQRTAVPSNGSDAPSDGEHDKYFVVREVTESCKRSRCGTTYERHAGGSIGKESSPSSGSDCDRGTQARKLPWPLGASSYSLVELSEAYERASEALNKEKKRVDIVFAVITEEVTKVSQLSDRFHSVATVPVIQTLTRIKYEYWRWQDACNGEFEKRFDVIEAYVSRMIIEAGRNQTVTDNTDLMEDATGDEDQRMDESHRHLHSCTVEQAVALAQNSLTIVAYQWNVLSQLCAIAERFVSRVKISCDMVLNCLTSIVAMVTPAVVTCKVIKVVMGALDREGQSVPELRNAASATARWTNEALLYAERAMDLHRDACNALHVARWDLDVMRGFTYHGIRVVVDISAVWDRFRDLIRQSNINMGKVRVLSWHMYTMRRLLMPDLINMRNFGNLIEQWSDISSDTVSTVLQTLSLASRSSSNAIVGAVKAVEDISIYVSMSHKDNP